MKHAKTIVTLGLFVALLPFLGFPSSWKTVFFVLFGLTISALAFRLLLIARNMEPDMHTPPRKENNKKDEVFETEETSESHE